MILPGLPRAALRPPWRERWGLGGLSVLAAGLVLSVGATLADEVDPVLAELGEATFQKHCASCHGADARGKGPVAEALVVPPADLTRIAARREGNFPAGEIGRFIDGRFELAAHGTREMPVWGERLSSDVPDDRLAEEIKRGTIASLVEYLKSIQVKP